MDQLHAAGIKIVAAGGDLSGAPVKELYKDVLNIEIERILLEDFNSKFPQPVTRYEIGTNFMIKGTLHKGTLSDLVTLLGGVNTSEVYTKTQQVLVLPKYDIEVLVYRPSDGAEVPWRLYDCQNTEKVSLGMEHGKVTYLGFAFSGTDTSSLEIDNSVTV